MQTIKKAKTTSDHLANFLGGLSNSPLTGSVDNITVLYKQL